MIKLICNFVKYGDLNVKLQEFNYFTTFSITTCPNLFTIHVVGKPRTTSVGLIFAVQLKTYASDVFCKKIN